MSLKSVHLPNLIKKQFQYKLKSYIGIFSSIVVVQLIGMLFSETGGTRSDGPDGLMISVDYYSANVVIGFTMITILINAIHVTTKTFQEDGFIFVGNRLSANLSNVLFLVTVSIFGGITAILSGFLVRMGTMLLHTGAVLGDQMDMGFSELLYGIGASIAFMLLAAAVGYICGSLVQISRVFMFIIPAVLYGIAVLRVNNQGDQFGEVMFNFFFQETSFPLLWAKVIIVSAIMFACSLFITNKKEVRQ